jgi:hypothetical protein
MVTRYVSRVLPLARIASIAATMACAAVIAAGCGSSATTNVVGPTATKCQVSVSNSMSQVPASGGRGTLTVSSERECSWSASTNASWIALASTTGQGAATIDYSVQPNPNGTSRRAQVTVSNESLDVVQAPAPCKFAIDPASLDVGAAPADVTFALTATPGCQWTAKSNVDWIVGASPSQGTGGANVTFSVVANTADARVGSISIGDAQAAVRQSAVAAPPPAPVPPTPGPPPPGPPVCTYTVAPSSASTSAAGGDVQVVVTASDGCAWTAVSNAVWMTIKSGATGSGNGFAVATVAANAGVARTGTLTVAGRTVTINQAAQPAPACTYQLTPSSLDVASGAQDIPVAVATGDTCQWTATSDVPWITIGDPASGAGPGTARLSVAANTGDARTGVVHIGTATFTLRQAAPLLCTYAIKPTGYDSGRGPDAIDVAVTADALCPWTASTDASWISITSGSSGIGSGTVHLVVEANAGAPRTAIVTIAGLPFTLRQEGVCTYAIKPNGYDAGRGQETITIDVTADAGCSWTATSPVTWATITEGASGTGSGSVKVTLQMNDDADRAATLTIAGQEFHLTQKGKR